MVFLRSRLFASICVCLSFFASPGLAIYGDSSCCNSARLQNAFQPAPTGPVICGQEYNSSIPAAPTLTVSYKFCKENCGGFGLSPFEKPSSWAAPIVNFILPAVIFSMSIPRRKVLSFYSLEKTQGRNIFEDFLYYSGLSALFQMFVVTLDSVIWIAIIFTMAGPMMLSGLYEAVLDWQILNSLLQPASQSLSEGEKVELLATVICGNLLASGPPSNPNTGNAQHEIVQQISNSQDAEYKRSCLLGLLSSQMGFGAIVGAPVLFYLGAFVYTILDLSNDPSDQDAAISLAFGVEWMIIVHVAIVGSCLLATNNPSTASVVVGKDPVLTFPGIRKIGTTELIQNTSQRGFWGLLSIGQFKTFGFMKDIYQNRYQPVTMWNRGQNKYGWVQESKAWTKSPDPGQPKFKDSMRKLLRLRKRKSFWFVLLPTYVLIYLPAAAGGMVAWRTPPVGWGCRSLNLMCYGGIQAMLMQLYICVQHSFFQGTASFFKKLGRDVVWILYGLACIASLFVVIGGTMMQLIGVYRNCFCYVNAPEWYSLDSASVQVATDTQLQRDSAQNWKVFGAVATTFMGVCCFGAWWYQKVIRDRYKKIVDQICPP